MSSGTYALFGQAEDMREDMLEDMTDIALKNKEMLVINVNIDGNVSRNV